MIWTMDDIRGAAAVACSRIRVSPGTAYEVDMNDVAQSAIGLAIAENPEIDWPDAVAAAARDVWDAQIFEQIDSAMEPLLDFFQALANANRKENQ